MTGIEQRRLPYLITITTRLLPLCTIFTGSALFSPVSIGQEIDDSLERDYGDQLSRIPPKDAQDALNTFEVHPHFRIELVAAEPLVRDPVAMAFDESGRLYVVEMRGYSEARNDLIGSVRLLTDLDSDGVFDTSSIFADGLVWPTAVASGILRHWEYGRPCRCPPRRATSCWGTS